MNASPAPELAISTRESQRSREKVLALGISQISGGSRTSVGGYAEEELPEENSAQFDLSDTRTLDEIVAWLLKLGYIPSFCTACYREGRGLKLYLCTMVYHRLHRFTQIDLIIKSWI